MSHIAINAKEMFLYLSLLAYFKPINTGIKNKTPNAT